MAQDAQRRQNPASGVAGRPWVWVVVSIVMLLAIATALAVVAGQYYDSTAPDTFRSVLASNLLQGAVITIGAAVIAILLGLIQEMRAKRERDTTKRLELFRRMRAAHVRIASAQRLLKADSNPKAYGKQMRALMVITRDLEEVREEVRVSSHLYKEHDRRSIMEGIAMMIEFLERGSSEYIHWCNRARGLKGRPRGNRWVADLVAAPEMPDDYERGLTKSKGKMRAYVYGTRRRRPYGLSAGAVSSADRYGADGADRP